MCLLSLLVCLTKQVEVWTGSRRIEKWREKRKKWISNQFTRKKFVKAFTLVSSNKFACKLKMMRTRIYFHLVLYKNRKREMIGFFGKHRSGNKLNKKTKEHFRSKWISTNSTWACFCLFYLQLYSCNRIQFITFYRPIQLDA